MSKVGVGVTTYGSAGVKLTEALLRSIREKTEFDKDFTLLVLDDGTPDTRAVDELARITWIYDAEFEQHKTNDGIPKNEGIPKSWNDCVKILHDRFGCEDIILLNNDLLVLHSEWLRNLVFFLDNNEKIATVGLPLVQMDPATGKISPYNPESFGTVPGLCGAAVGCCFGLKYSVWKKIKNPDSSIGYFEALRSFHEETLFSLRLAAEFEYLSYMLPWPPIAHAGGLTFRLNPVLTEMKWPSAEEVGLPINREEYIEVVRKSNIYPEVWKKDKIIWKNKQGEEVVDRMAFSRYLFCLFWKSTGKHPDMLDHYDNPHQPIHDAYVEIFRGTRKVKFIDKDGKVREAVV